jgi:hypothetical protein
VHDVNQAEFVLAAEQILLARAAHVHGDRRVILKYYKRGASTRLRVHARILAHSLRGQLS